MTWLQKIATITFSVADSHKMSRPKSIFYISSEMNYWAHKNVPRNLLANVPEPIAMDGFGVDELLGTINWYYEQDTPESREDITMYVGQYEQEELTAIGIQLDPNIRFEMSKMFGIPVARIRVINNDTVNINRPPELNVSNRNAMILMGLLGINAEYAGSINATELIAKIDQNRARIEQFSLPGERSEGKGKPTTVTFGLSPEQLKRYIDNLENMATQAQNMHNPTITWG